jgi:hypothetical protein
MIGMSLNKGEERDDGGKNLSDCKSGESGEEVDVRGR